jgi:hypothetical protein
MTVMAKVFNALPCNYPKQMCGRNTAGSAIVPDDRPNGTNLYTALMGLCETELLIVSL